MKRRRAMREDLLCRSIRVVVVRGRACDTLRTRESANAPSNGLDGNASVSSLIQPTQSGSVKPGAATSGGSRRRQTTLSMWVLFQANEIEGYSNLEIFAVEIKKSRVNGVNGLTGWTTVDGDVGPPSAGATRGVFKPPSPSSPTLFQKPKERD